jgi:AraC-like DNA-binding protein
MGLFARAAVLNKFAEVTQSLNLDPFLLLDRAGIPRKALHDPDMRISADRTAHVLEIAANEAAVDDLGLRMAENRRISTLGPLWLALREEPTLRRALQVLMRFLHLQNEASKVQLEEHTDIAIASIHWVGRESGESVRQTTELSVAMFRHVLQELLGPEWKPQRICFSHSVCKNPLAYQRFFNAPVQFSAEFDGIVLARRDLDQSITQSDPALAKYTRQYLDSITGDQEVKLSDKVRQMVYALLPAGDCSVDTIAKSLGIDRSTLRRKLAPSGDTFSSIVDSIRVELAVRYLSGQRPLAEVTLLLGFSEQSVLTRWFTRRFGCGPSAWRKLHRSEQ